MLVRDVRVVASRRQLGPLALIAILVVRPEVDVVKIKMVLDVGADLLTAR